MNHGQVVDGHLGGYVPNGDPATYFPELWDWLVKGRGVKSVIDVGCGDGVALRHFEMLLGSENVFGLEGIPQDHPRIEQHDFTLGAYPIKGEYDLCWCCEFLEHMEERFLPNVLPVFAGCKIILITHAFPGQGGHHHVLCRDASYWIGVLAAIGYRFDSELTKQTREFAVVNPSPWNHYKRSGMAFVRV